MPLTDDSLYRVQSGRRDTILSNDALTMKKGLTAKP